MDKWEYSIRISKLPSGVHHYDFQVTNSLKEKFESQLVNYFDVLVKVQLRKNVDFIEAVFKMTGKVGLSCDRCNRPYDFQIDTTHKVLYTFRPITNHNDDEIIFLEAQTDYLDLSQEFYDFICLSIPQRKVPADCPMEGCPDLFYNEQEEEIDPRWAKLLELKNKED